MPGNFNQFSRKECIRAIINFLDFTKETGIDPLLSLSEIVAHYLDDTHEGILSKQSHIQAVAALKTICETMHIRSQSNLLEALTTACYQHTSDARLRDVLSGIYCPAKIMAAFHHEAITHQNEPFQFIAHLELQAELSVQQRATLLLCINWYAPDLVIFGNFADGSKHQSNCLQLQNIVNCLTHNVSFTYANNCLGIIKDEQRKVFLDSIAKASKLVLDATGLNQWSAKDWDDFIAAVVKNDQLSSISLNNNELDQSCKDPKKFAYILYLFKLPHVHELYVHNNNLASLPFKLFQLLQQAINLSPIAELGFTPRPDINRGTASTGGIFAVNKSAIPEYDMNGPEGDMSKSGEFEIEECGM